MSASVPLLEGAAAPLAPFAEAGVVDAAGVHVAVTAARHAGDESPPVVLALALCVRALQLGHTCLDPSAAPALASPERRPPDGADRADADAGAAPAADLPWPDPAAWEAALRRSPAVTVVPGDGTGGGGPAAGHAPLRPLVLDRGRVYLERYWRYEQLVAGSLRGRSTADADADTGTGTGTGRAAAPVGPARLERVLDDCFGAEDPSGPDLQRRAARVALTRRLAVVAGGPGTGKTYTVARLLAAAHQLAADEGRRLDVALAAPTGKAAKRMTEAIGAAAAGPGIPPGVADRLREDQATTLHRLLGPGDGVRFRHDRSDPLPHDLVVVDETSMVALPLMARLLDAVRDDARVVLVGDPYQLASVEVGAVLGDVVGPAALGGGVPADGPLAAGIVVLERVRRFGADSAIAALADAVRTGDADAAVEVLRSAAGGDELDWVDPADDVALGHLRAQVVAAAVQVGRAAVDGDATAALAHLAAVKVLCATRWGPQGSYAWRDHVEAALGRQSGLSTAARWYVGRPVIATRNDHLLRVFNGDTGVVVRTPSGAVVAMPAADGVRSLAPSQLEAVETWWSMTVHKSQGSEYDHAVVSLPERGSRVLTRELLYTGVTRGRRRVTVVATESVVRDAVLRPVARASGLGDRLWGPAAG